MAASFTLFDNLKDRPSILYGLAPQRCAVCASTSHLQHCAACKVVSYCGREHQTNHWQKHKAACTAIKRSQEKLEREEAALRALPPDMGLPPDVFNTGVGRFWGIYDTRDYMRARFAAADALLRVDTVLAVEAALAHFNDMLRLCRSDNMGVRDIIPSLLLRLGREQECYDFLKWWTVMANDSHYDWGNVSLPYLDIRGADAFEPVDLFCSGGTNLSHLVSLTLLKLRLYLDLDACNISQLNSMLGQGPGEPDRPIGKLAKAKRQMLGRSGVEAMAQTLESQYKRLCKAVHDKNPYFWGALVDESEEEIELPASYTIGSKEEADLVLYQCKRAWEESEDAISMVNSDTWKFARKYEGSGTVPVAQSGVAVVPAGASSARPEERGGSLEKRRATGAAFPSRFRPRLPTASPAELFRPTPIGSDRSVRFVCCDDQRKVLVYVDGACVNNGQFGARAGWAVVYGPPDRSSGVVSSRLEKKGPFGDESVPTSNRAELRAAIAALRLCDWREDGFNNIVIATDSSYLVDGATDWVRGWLQNGWKTRMGEDAKNRDLWELLLGEVERAKERGLRVELWKIPRELNGDADAAAKTSADEPGIISEFRDLVVSRPETSGARTGGKPRVLALCLENEFLFDAGDLAPAIASRTEMKRATTQEAAIQMLTQEPLPPVILVTDGAIARRRKLLERVIDRLRGGATVVLAGSFSSMVNLGELNRLFVTLGLPWVRGSYHRSTCRLRRNAVGAHLASRLASQYSAKALYIKNVDASAVWYEADGETAVAFAKIGEGRLGYIGDVNGEAGSNAAVLAMCGLLD